MKPGFIAELGLPQNRPRLWMGVWSGYGMAAAFGLLVVLGHVLELVVNPLAIYGLVGLKLLTNALAHWSLLKDRWALELGGLNVAMDIFVMTGAIYLTGGPVSPLFSIYVIEVAVLSLLTNTGVTVLTLGTGMLLYAGMSAGIFLGYLPRYPAPFEITDQHPSFFVISFAFGVFVLTVTGAFTSAALRLLRTKEVALAETNRRLVEAGREKAEFMANITHELRTPIHGINGLTDIMVSGVYGPLTEKQRKAVLQIKQSGQSLLHMVDDLLRLSQAQAGKLTFHARWVEIGPLLDQVVSSAQWMIGTKDLKMECEVQGEVGSAQTDRGKLTHILLNLLSNAVKFTPDGGRIRIVASGDEENVSVAVIDTGVGIADEDRRHIFEAFSQLEGGDERSWGGMGVGLALVRRMAHVLGGRVEVESTPGAGSTFRVVVPRRPFLLSAMASATSSADEIPSGSLVDPVGSVDEPPPLSPRG